MTSQVITSVENNFTRGLITEATGLNFPENAATDADNCEFTIIGDVVRREGIDFEENFTLNSLQARTGAVSSYKWNNAGGDGNTQVIVVQNGGTLYFYKSSAATTSAPVSTTLLASTVTLATFLPTGSTQSGNVNAAECQFSDGNGYLFVNHPYLDPFYCTYTAGTITPTVINIKTRDFKGITENIPVNFRPPSPLSAIHEYNIKNQGWTSSVSWSGTSISSPTLTSDINGNWTVAASTTFLTQTGLPVVAGQFVTITGGMVFTRITVGVTIQGQVASYSGATLVVNVISCVVSPQAKSIGNSLISANWNIISAVSNDHINTWFSAVTNYPSNADVWWVYKDTSGVFNPATTINNFPPPTAQAAQGHFILNEFNQQRSAISGVANLTDITTFIRPRTGTWFQGRVWFTGVDDAFPATGTAAYTTWTENIYFSQTITSPTQFGNCYQEDDPTDENLSQLLPTDGGVITIPGSGSIFKLFPVVNGMIVFAGNGVWFITGSQGIGFAANDYTITKLSSVQCISSTSFVDVMGLPYFWNEEGIYSVEANQSGNLSVNPITVSTILTFYNSIPTQSKKFVRGAYHPIDYVIQWIYKADTEVSVTDRYAYDSILNYNVYNKAFFPYSIDNSNASINSIVFVQNPGGSNGPDSSFKYLSSFIQSATPFFTFADEHDTNFVDWHGSGTDFNYTSTFTTGYKIHGDGLKKTTIPYVSVFSRTNDEYGAYFIQGLWDYANNRNSNRWSVQQFVEIYDMNKAMVPRRHRIRGRGLTLQLKYSSVDGKPFDIMGWAVYENVNAGV